PPRHRGSRRDGVGRSGGVPARARARSRPARLAGGGVCALPRLRHRQAVADPRARAPLPRRLRRDVRRHRLAGLDGAGARDPEEGLFLNELAEKVGAALKRAGLLIATAESCTGGWVAQEVTAIAGSSNWFDRGFVTYSNAAKQEMLGVKEKTLEAHGAV